MTSQSYHVLKLGVLHMVGMGNFGRVSYDVFLKLSVLYRVGTGILGRVSHDVFCNLFLLYLASTYITTTCQI